MTFEKSFCIGKKRFLPRVCKLLIASVVLVFVLMLVACNNSKPEREELSDGGWIEYEYDSNGNRIKATGFESDGTVRYQDEFVYDNNGNRTKETRFGSDGTVLHQEEYDSRGRVTAYQQYDPDGSSVKYKVDSKGNDTYVIVYDSAGHVVHTQSLEYD